MSGDHLPQELLIQILLWLPPKSLLRFRCVSKSWCSLISSPNFIDIYPRNLPHVTNTRKLIRHCPTTSPREEVYSVFFDNQSSFDHDDDVKIDFPFTNTTEYRIVGSCNGLICLSDEKIWGDAYTTVLWNPAIRRKLTLPPPNIIVRNPGSLHVLGFGFDCKANDYKIVQLSYKNPASIHSLPSSVEVFSVNTGAWRGICIPAPLCHIAGDLWRQRFVNGAAHWVAYTRNCGQMRNLILSFDMCDEVFREIKLPECLVAKSLWYMGVVVIQDSLSVVEYDKSLEFLNMLSIWVMKDYGVVESWTKQYKIDTEVGLVRVLGVRRNGEVLLTTRNDELVDYDVQTRESRDLITGEINSTFFVDTYKESFALLFEGGKSKSREGSWAKLNLIRLDRRVEFWVMELN
ncbi:hypothetical protein LguiB_020559 [Lonicera macranthoides]